VAGEIAPTVLFVCEHNAGRSQLAAGLAAAYAGDRVNMLSAGTVPDVAVSPVMVASLAELGIDRSDQVPTRLTDDLLRRADIVVALKAGLRLALPTGIDQQTWDLPNPADWDVDSIRPLRDHIQQRVQDFIDQLMTIGRPAASQRR
jgi:arsenate reductase (thioredoxin)